MEAKALLPSASQDYSSSCLRGTVRIVGKKSHLNFRIHRIAVRTGVRIIYVPDFPQLEKSFRGRMPIAGSRRRGFIFAPFKCLFRGLSTYVLTLDLLSLFCMSAGKKCCKDKYPVLCRAAQICKRFTSRLYLCYLFSSRLQISSPLSFVNTSQGLRNLSRHTIFVIHLAEV